VHIGQREGHRLQREMPPSLTRMYTRKAEERGTSRDRAQRASIMRGGDAHPKAFRRTNALASAPTALSERRRSPLSEQAHDMRRVIKPERRVKARCVSPVDMRPYECNALASENARGLRAVSSLPRCPLVEQSGVPVSDPQVLSRRAGARPDARPSRRRHKADTHASLGAVPDDRRCAFTRRDATRMPLEGTNAHRHNSPSRRSVVACARARAGARINDPREGARRLCACAGERAFFKGASHRWPPRRSIPDAPVAHAGASVVF